MEEGCLTPLQLREAGPRFRVVPWSGECSWPLPFPVTEVLSPEGTRLEARASPPALGSGSLCSPLHLRCRRPEDAPSSSVTGALGPAVSLGDPLPQPGGAQQPAHPF